MRFIAASKPIFLQYEDTVEDNSNDSWWLEAIKVVKDVESKHSATELSTKENVSVRIQPADNMPCIKQTYRGDPEKKQRKSSILLPTERFKCKNLSEEDMFMASLICNRDVDYGKLLVCKPGLDCVKTLHFDIELNCNLGNYVQIHPELTLNACSKYTQTLPCCKPKPDMRNSKSVANRNLSFVAN
ncbi:hypothetical protein KIW84_023514 [Lathyrus oleraceus]|uniref:DNA-directed primase/polymerase protein n=1 Tax=Pisum sativum TaxID=3888 RepID=A0A9D4YH10_PEA|nr:hypothetical protein KIW84_023513 [Pisum sativum]KAI5437425.1 hypothetical protein KIW84_023514 [Pisum sativum]